MVSNNRLGLIDRDLSIVDAQTMTMGIRVREKTTLKHTIRRNVNTRNNVSRGESSLFNFGKVVFRITVKSHLANRVQGIILSSSLCENHVPVSLFNPPTVTLHMFKDLPYETKSWWHRRDWSDTSWHLQVPWLGHKRTKKDIHHAQ